MKKMGFLMLLLFMMLFISGCGTNNTKVLTCSGVSPGTNMNAASDVKYTFKDDKLSKVEAEFVFKDITVNNLSSIWDMFKAQFTEQNPPVEETGFKRSVKSDDKNFTFSVIIEIDYEKVTKETLEKYGYDDLSLKTYDEVKLLAISDASMTCK